MRPKQQSNLNSIEQRLGGGPWYAEGLADEVAAAVLQSPKRFDELFECLLSPDKGVSKRASQALLIVSQRRPDLFQPYKEVLFSELIEQDKWYVRYRLCLILPRLRLNPDDIARAAEIFQDLLDGSQNALSVSALEGLAELALLEPSRREEFIWLIERKARAGTPAMKARGRRLLARLYKNSGNGKGATILEELEVEF